MFRFLSSKYLIRLHLLTLLIGTIPVVVLHGPYSENPSIIDWFIECDDEIVSMVMKKMEN
ncbi:hypothetical protein LJR153_002365 [Paenibacillus sp. LjRoot153]|uniref:hypothetical protein n=1 Tax=Paenibacillus sp. LjRoot153 TaxID=3342270 RepID=UPI003ECC9B63